MLGGQVALWAKLPERHRLATTVRWYEARLAEKQYSAVDPDNRLVASELERRWERALQTLMAVRESAPEWLVKSALERFGLSKALTGSVAAVSVGIVDATPLLDLDYAEDSTAEVDMNVVMTGDGRLVEVQATAERDPFTRALLDELLELAATGIDAITEAQLGALEAALA